MPTASSELQVKPSRYVRNHESCQISGFGRSRKRAYSEFQAEFTAVLTFQLNNYAPHITLHNKAVVLFCTK